MDRALRAWKAIDHFGTFQTLVGLPAWLLTVSTSLSAAFAFVVAYLAETPWWWRIVLFIVVAVGMLILVNAAVWGLFYPRWHKVATMRGLLREAAVEAAKPHKPGDTHAAWVTHRIGLFIELACTHGVIADYKNFLEVHRSKSERRTGSATHYWVLAGEYCTALAERITFNQIDHTYHLPATFKKFLDATEEAILN
jgi:hypothetical protein